MSIIALGWMPTSCILLAYLGWSYGGKAEATILGLLWRLALYTSLLCWSVIFEGIGHGGIAFPVPSVLCFAADCYPSFWISPVIQIVCFIAFAFISAYRTKTSNSEA